MKRWIFILLLSLPSLLEAQIGGRHVYSFLNLSPAPRAAALGGVNISTYDHDANFAYMNPALTNESMSGQASFSIANYLAGITYGYASYAQSFEGVGSFHTGIQYLSYGDLVEADVYGNQTGTFSAGDFAWVAGGAIKKDLFRFGVNMKVINSNVARYQSRWAMGFDLGGAYISKKGNFTAGMVFKNMGFNLTRWNVPDGVTTPLPFEIQIGISHKLEHMP
ncbi:MAG: type IX secretion system protein PorQ, partial [Bacteroidota bacterium]